MNPKLLKVVPKINHSFSVRRDVVPYFYNHWHFHPELELLLVEKGSGIQFIGDSILSFKKGDLILVGSNLPHYWRCDDAHFEAGSKLKAIALVAHFREEFWGQDFLELPENKKIKDLFLRAKRGLQITGKTKTSVSFLLKELLDSEGSERIVLLLQVLNEIAKSKSVKLLSTQGFQPAHLEGKETEKINQIFKYSLDHFKNKITLNDVAANANISPNSFCRYFKQHTRKTYNRFLQELRVGHASKLLIENKLNITQICYESGFNNITNFYKAFKKITGKTPLSFQKAFISFDEQE
ncbi:AraC family transcriptional regulator [Flavihumibacter sp. RY-1]|uniref:AraC family transcriptional regulator n=1 Tax=Flavihumibacter fluminis TaxID=2909236 RepID=A0ABS9BF09_9BACT|nr:AraC family transcriptional regulator [Flavihumibacter fluminis]MCF1713719.1 AraC family transcriptional regulator [Flavihumibacter fluminis]